MFKFTQVAKIGSGVAVASFPLSLAFAPYVFEVPIANPDWKLYTFVAVLFWVWLMTLYSVGVSFHYHLWPKNVKLSNNKIVRVTALMEATVAQRVEEEPTLNYEEVLIKTAHIYWFHIGVALHILAFMALAAFFAIKLQSS